MMRVLRRPLVLLILFAIAQTMVANVILWRTDWPPLTTRVAVMVGAVLALYLLLTWRHKRRERTAEPPPDTEQGV